MRKLTVILFIFFVSSVFSQEKYSKIRIKINLDIIYKLRQTGIDFENVSGKKNTFVDMELSESELDKLTAKGIKYKILIDDISDFYKKRYKKSAFKNKNSLKGIKYTTPVHFNYGSMGGFLTLSEVYDELDEMHSVYPDLISEKFTAGNTQTIEGREVYAVRISDNPDIDEDEPEVLYTALIHAREPESMQQLIWFMWYLLENYDTDNEITYLLDNLELYFIPVINPDGYEYNHQTNPDGGGMWRKNKRDNNNNGSFSEYDDGVDLNRNFSYKWAYDNDGSSPDPTSNTYRGTNAFSEPETQILRDFVNEHNFLLAHNHHTYSNLLLFPWGYEEIHTPDDDIFRSFANLMTSENGYETGQAWEILYTVNGDANDWMYGEQTSKPEIFAFTQETGNSSDGFWPSQDRIIPLCEESYISNLYLAKLATPYADLTDLSEQFIPKTGYLKFNLKKAGLSGNGNYTLTVNPDNNVFQSIGNSLNIYLPNVNDQKTDSVAYILSNDMQYGDEFTFTVTISSGNYSLTKSFTKSYYNTEIIIEDNGNNLDNWISTSWEATNESYSSPDSSVTDSKGTEYQNNASTSITYDGNIDLTDTDNAILNFKAKWNIENNWDYAQLLISTDNGTSWTPAETDRTNPGEGSFQPTGEPVYDGAADWGTETLDLSSYTGQNIKFRFELHSDGYITEDGFYFDDFKIIKTSSALSASISAEPGCGSNSGKITVYSNRNENQTFYLCDIDGNILQQQTSNSDYYTFTGLPDNTYRGKTDNGSETSRLSESVQLTNDINMPEAPGSVYADNNEACNETVVTLTYDGGSGTKFVWYNESCGNGIAGYGNNFTFTLNSDTTFFGRWENACGVSDCKQVNILTVPETEITENPQNKNANIGETVNFSVTAEGDNLTYQWQKDGNDISGATNTNLTLNDIDFDDAGNYSVKVTGTCGTEISETAVLSVSSSVKNLKPSKLNIYPNPAKEEINISLENKDALIEISDISGKIILKQKFQNQETAKINIEHINADFVIIKIKTSDKIYTEKLIIK
ncbi:MAG: T9SS type A sorting domain-containing protein [Chlorobi bacterium]|nr:T9SS type A sorting domain-containing protein [Chlorobiota bacterium]